MKKVLIAGVFLLGLVASATAALVLVEDYQDADITIPDGEQNTLTVAEVIFFVDSACYAWVQ